MPTVDLSCLCLLWQKKSFLSKVSHCIHYIYRYIVTGSFIILLYTIISESSDTGW